MLRQGLHLNDACNHSRPGRTSPKFQEGRYLDKIPLDPWGRDYLLDSNVGLIISFGADGLAGGANGDTDIFTDYNHWGGCSHALSIRRVQYDGSWGIPKKGNEVIISMTKPFKMTSNNLVENTLQILTDLRKQDSSDDPKGKPVSFSTMNKLGEVPPRWIAGGFDPERPLSKWEQGCKD